MLKKITYFVFLAFSVFFLILLFFKIDQCEEESYGWYGDKNIEGLLFAVGLFLVIQFLVYFFGIVKLIIWKLRKKDLNKVDIICNIKGVLLFIIWLITLGIYSKNGQCDVIIGPADSGFFLAMIASILFNYWKIKSLKLNR